MTFQFINLAKSRHMNTDCNYLKRNIWLTKPDFVLFFNPAALPFHVIMELMVKWPKLHYHSTTEDREPVAEIYKIVFDMALHSQIYASFAKPVPVFAKIICVARC